MPFQVSYSNRPRIFQQVELVTAGEDQLHICTPTIYLEGIVNGDLLGHTIEWEQIDGTLVTLVNANTLTPHFDFEDSTDKVFRLYIDRGTPYEQFDDVKIWKTPTSLGECFFNNNQQTYADVLDPLPVACDDITAEVEVIVPPPTSLQGEETGYIINYIIRWQHPGDTVKDLHIEQYRVYENTLEVDRLPDTPIPNAGDIQGAAGGPPTETLEYYGTLAEYRIDTHYNIGGRNFVRESCVKDFTGLVTPSVVAYNDAVTGMNFPLAENQSKLELVKFSNIFLKDNDDVATAEFHPDQSPATTFTRYGFVLIDPPTDGIPDVTFQTNRQTINITRYGGSGIGGG